MADTSRPGSASRPPATPLASLTLRWGAVAGWSGVIFAFSAMPGSRVPGRFGTPAHFIEYAVLASLLYLALRLHTGGTRAALLAVLLASGYAVTDEFHQAFVPLRVPDPLDWAVDTAGAVAGAYATAYAERRFAKRRGGSG